MREIKFRAWDLIDQTMYQAVGTDFAVALNGALLGFDTTTGKGYLEVHSSTYILMQYTGLKDKNGKEIYEGDILKDEEDALHTIVWNAEYATFCYSGESYIGLGSKENDLVEVIGNIMENPELLK